jgi:hypothetical protein
MFYFIFTKIRIHLFAFNVVVFLLALATSLQ